MGSTWLLPDDLQPDKLKAVREPRQLPLPPVNFQFRIRLDA